MDLELNPYAPDSLPNKGFENDPGNVKNSQGNGGDDNNNPPLEVPDQNQTPENIPEKD